MGIDLKKVGAFAINPNLGAGLLAKDHLDNAGKDMPAYNAPALDKTTQSIMAGQADRAKMSEADIVAEKMAGADRGSGLINQDPIDAQNRALGMSTPGGMSEALQQRSQKYFSGEMAKNQGKAKASAAGDRYNRNAQALKNSMTLEQQETAIRQRKAQHEKNVQAARNQALGDVLGIGGAVGGGVIGAAVGGPKGAAMGAKVGGSASAFAGDTEMKGMGQ